MSFKRLCACLAALLVLSVASGRDFNAKKVVLNLAVMSDTHVDGYNTVPAYKFRSALIQDRDFAAPYGGLDGVLLVGDLVDSPAWDARKYPQIDDWKRLYESVFNPVETPMVYTVGNHDIWREWTVNTYREGEGAALHTASSPGACPDAGKAVCLDWARLGASDLLPVGHAIGEPELLFAKIEDDAIEAQLSRLDAIRAEKEAEAKAEAAKVVAPQKEECTFEEFDKMDIRTATVLEAERVPKTDKLLKLTIDTGIDTRTIVSGIAEYYSPEDMLGKQICILANLKPRMIRGIESKGMILMARQGDGTMRFITPQEVLANGAQIG